MGICILDQHLCKGISGKTKGIYYLKKKKKIDRKV